MNPDRIRHIALQRFLDGERGYGEDFDNESVPTYYIETEEDIYRTRIEPRKARMIRYGEDPDEVPTDGIRATYPAPVPFAGY